LIVESLQKGKHDRLGFSCGNESLDRFFQEHAHQAALKDLSRTYVGVDENDETVVLGYYTVTPCRIEAGELPRTLMRLLRLPDRDLPASLIARLAVSKAAQGKGVGSLLLIDALVRCARVTGEIGGIAIVVDAMEDAVAPFYERLGFRRLELESRRMFIPMATIRNLLGMA
jgi:GNAT superfamily N-acetyltransferase